MTTLQPVPPNATYLPLATQLAELGAEAVVEALGSYEGLLAKAATQDEAAVTKAPKITKEMLQIRWEAPAEEVYRLWRALSDTFGVHSFLPDGKTRIKLVRLEGFGEAAQRDEPGTMRFLPRQKLLTVACGDGRCVLVGAVQLEGRRAQSPQDFANGYFRGQTGAAIRLLHVTPAAASQD